MITAREAAFRALGDWRRTKAWPDAALSALLERSGATRREAALASRLVGGVMQNMALCDFYAAHFSTMGLKKVEPRVLDILRLSIYQIVFLTKIPNSAAVSEGVALAKKYANPRAAAFVNAVLRKVADAAENNGLPVVAGEPERVLSIEYSHPEWLVREFCEILGMENAERFLSVNNAESLPVTAQVNTLLTDTEAAASLLVSGGAEVSRHEWLDGCLELRGAGNIGQLEAFRNGSIYIQDAAARLAVSAAAPKPHDFVIDGCAAPGGKSFAAAIMMENKGKVAAFDVNAAKLRHITDGAARLGIGIIDVAEKDASAPVGELAGRADVVLADVPCSGFGVIRKKPEIRYKAKGDIEGLNDIQQRILSVLSSYVKPGGVLLYSTCTVLRRENEGVANWFLDNHSGFSTESFTLPGVGFVPGGIVTLWPQTHGTDGFFICKMRKMK